MRDISYGSRILFIEEGNTVRLVHCDRQVEHGKTFIVFGFTELNDIYVACVTVLVSGIVGNIDPALMIPAFVPVIQEADTLVFRDRLQEPADLGVAVDFHLL